MNTASTPAKMDAGIGGWVFDPWRDNGYPADSPQARKLECASHAPAVRCARSRSTAPTPTTTPYAPT
ncbi:MAG: hypothetical protein H7306_18060 [Bacteriovorax sp.]|nr:hypothetical protein [Rhizobacter sp.]